MIAKFHDVKLKDMSNEEIRRWARCLPYDNVVVLRNQDLSKADLSRVYNSIGNTLKTDEFFCDDEYPELMRVTNERKDGEKTGIFADKELDWHSNGNGRPSGVECCVGLYCVKPGKDSVTSFCDTRKAYDDLNPAMKIELENIKCLFKFENNTFYELDEDDKELVMFENRGEYVKGTIKPLVYKHPFDGKKGLYFTFHYIQKMYRVKPERAKFLKECLMDHVFQDKYIYHHDDWQPGDLIFMDQFHSIHKRNAVEGDRFMYRTTLDYAHVYDTNKNS
ncbi:TauD/TfdA family dioxygenase [bacterium]|nr:TauD/TfdA family dioxygenase [bacterium]